MYKINHIHNKEQELNYLTLESVDNNSNAKICLELGGSLQELKLNNNSIIKDLHPLTYETTYASAVLFPFSNRIKDGKYTFKQKQYQLHINRKEENNALHGLVYNKAFNVIKKDFSNNYASVTLSYTEIKRVKGFPFYYSIFLTYTLTQSTINLKVTLNNLDENPLPFTIGWHPYFNSSNLFNSCLVFESNKKILFDKRMITTGIENIETENTFEIKDKKLDDCFVLNSNQMQFKTPDYSLALLSSSKENYLQLYTPSKSNTIAIEPSTGVSNSFNNKLGLQVLNARECYSIDWTIKLD